MLFHDRGDAGRQLARQLRDYADRNTIVLGLARGGVITASSVAQELKRPLDVIVTQKIGAPFNPEYAIGAIAEDGPPVLNQAEIAALGITSGYLNETIARERAEIRRRIHDYRQGRSLSFVAGCPTILVDDGVATGYTMLAAARAVRHVGAGEVVIAVPVAPVEALPRLRAEADAVVVLDTPEPFLAVGRFYEHFEQVSDEEVKRVLEEARRRLAA